MMPKINYGIAHIHFIFIACALILTKTAAAMETHKITVENNLNHKIKITQKQLYRDRVINRVMTTSTSHTIKPHSKKIFTTPSDKNGWAKLVLLMPDYYRPVIELKTQAKESTFTVNKTSEKSTGILVSSPTQEIAWTYPVRNPKT